jgi:trans-aconitate methyltransferase
MSHAGSDAPQGRNALYSLLPESVRSTIHRTRLRIRPGRLTAGDWARRSGSSADRYWRSIDQPHRKLVLEELHSFGEPRSLLELGCHSGPNLRLAAAEFPEARVSGIEINPAVVERARGLLHDDGLDRVELAVGSIVDLLPARGDDSQDVVFSCFALAYLPPAELVDVLAHCLRIARLGLVFAEPQPGEGQRAGLMHETDGWRHDYARVLRGLGVEARRIRIVELPESLDPLNRCLVADLRPTA